MSRGRTAPLDYIIGGLAVAIIGVGALGVYDALFARAETGASDGGNLIEEIIPRRFAGRKRITVLLAGVDERKGDAGRADAILVVFLNPQRKRVALLAMPRDLRVDLPCRNMKPKINHAYACGLRSGEGGMAVLRDVVEELVGESIDYHVKFTFQGFQKVIDELGGVEIEVKEYMKYDDDADGLHVDFEPGRHHMNGYEAMCFVRYRQPGRDVKDDLRYQGAVGTDRRVARQQQLLQAVMAQRLKASQAHRLAAAFPALLDAVETDLGLEEAWQLLALLRGVDADDIIVERVPHESDMIGGTCYDILQEGKFRNLRRGMFARLDAPATASGDQMDDDRGGAIR